MMARLLMFALKRDAVEALGAAWQCPTITGRTSYEERGRIYRAFNADPQGRLVASIHASATGWYAAPETVIMFHDDCLTDGALRRQAEARVHPSVSDGC